MTAFARLRLFLSDPVTFRNYLSCKLGQTTSSWRQRRRFNKIASAGRRLSRRLRSAIRSNGGNCEPDLRIYGDASQGHRIQLGRQTIIEHGCSFWLSPAEYQQSGQLVAGENLFLGFNTRINIYADVIIGRGVLIGANSYLASNNHNYQIAGLPIQSQGFSGASIIIGDDVWFGCNVVVVAGVTIGQGVVIGAGSVVTRDVPPFEVWAGVPAKKIKSR